MSEPIISPWLFFVIDGAKNVSFLFIFLGIIGFGATVFTLVARLDAYPSPNKDEKKTAIKKFKKLVPLSLIAIALGVLIPSKDTLYKMVIAQNITYERVGKAVDVGKELHDTIKQDVLDVIRELTKEKEKK